MSTTTTHLVAQNDDPEMLEWLSKAHTEAGGFLSAIAQAAIVADHETYPLIRPVIIALRRKYPKYEPSHAVKEEIAVYKNGEVNYSNAKLVMSPFEEADPADKIIIAGSLEYLAVHVAVAQLKTGARVLDATDFQFWLQELAEEIRK